MNDPLLGDWSDVEQLEEIAELQRGRGDDAEVPQLYYGSLDDFVREIIVQVYRRRVGSGPPTGGRPAGGATPRPSCGWTHYGGPGSSCAWTPPPA
ncbi:hypothetical protein [Cellulomonas sp. ATA003]|uniref:hypothetical protein n=1 Tax=Cellulomonas sp. ATA003 TaxID=3073064 RepID=UPI00287396CD|nr:hypothetical protein [Cellulomonas sp. ATA003]WNB87644.1 hypothetical protein REH70_10330 [Cellulomonas sp. ATA003]